MEKISKDYIKNLEKRDTGYKIFYHDWSTLAGTKYDDPVGHVFIQSGVIELCNNGLHYCHTIQDCFEYFRPHMNYHFCEIEAYDIVKGNGQKFCTNILYIKREIPLIELLSMNNINYNNYNCINSRLSAWGMLSNAIDFSSDVHYSEGVRDSVSIFFSKRIDSSRDVEISYHITNSKSIFGCTHVQFSNNLSYCKNMLFCKDLQYKDNYFFNKPSPYDLNKLFKMPLKELCKLLPTLSNYDPVLFFKLFPFTYVKLNTGKIFYIRNYNFMFLNDDKNIIDEYLVEDEWLKFVK
jgi:hypothetical protein